MVSRFLAALALTGTFGLTAARADTAQPTSGTTAEARGGMVVSVSRPASEIGRDVLKRGGNAVDAAVATAFALAVTWPEAGNLGGGGFMVIYPGGKTEPVVIDYRETAPAAASRDMFAKEGTPSSYPMAGIPGTVRGLALAHQRFGKLRWEDVVHPALSLAVDGFAVDEGLVRSLKSGLARSWNYPEFQRVFGKPDGEWKAGDRLMQPDLGRTLLYITAGGSDGFYKGPIADLIVEEMKRGNGLITAADLAGYQAKERKPIHGTYRGYDVYGPPPPSSGGICLVEMLNVLENFDLRAAGRWSPETLHRMTEAMRRAYCDRARYLGDSDFVKIPSHLTDKQYAKKLAESILPDKATPSGDLATDLNVTAERPHTTHFSVIDRDGMAVSNTYTLEDSFGGKVIVKGAGFLLNNEMGDFNRWPGVTTRGGLIGTPANLVEPGKRMLSSMCPTVVARDGKAVLVTGSPGGRTIINTVLCVVVNAIEFGMPLREAVDSPRMHHQWFPDRLLVEPALADHYGSTLEKLRAQGYEISNGRERQGDAHSIGIGPNGFLGVADRRTSGWAAGF
jgi:gamma-glutamyltranspeptidase/glutathione hydrolase